MLAFTNPWLFFARALPQNIFLDCAYLIRHTYCVIQNRWNFFPEEIMHHIDTFVVLVSEKFLSAHLFMPFVLYVFHESRWDSLLLTFPSGQGRQVGLLPSLSLCTLCNPTAPRPPLAQQEGHLQSESVFPPSYCLDGAWMNQQLLDPDHPHSYSRQLWVPTWRWGMAFDWVCKTCLGLKTVLYQLSTPGGNRAQLYHITVLPTIFYQSWVIPTPRWLLLINFPAPSQVFIAVTESQTAQMDVGPCSGESTDNHWSLFNECLSTWSEVFPLL